MGEGFNSKIQIPGPAALKELLLPLKRRLKIVGRFGHGPECAVIVTQNGKLLNQPLWSLGRLEIRFAVESWPISPIIAKD